MHNVSTTDTAESVPATDAVVDGFLTRPEAADYLRGLGYPISKTTLQKKATTGGGPPYQIFGNKALYTRRNLARWAAEQLSALRTSTSEAA